MLEVECGCTGQYAVEKPKHLPVRVSASAKQDDAGPVGLLERNQAWVVEVGGNNNSLLAPCDRQQFVVRGPSESEIDGVDRVMTGRP